MKCCSVKHSKLQGHNRGRLTVHGTIALWKTNKNATYRCLWYFNLVGNIANILVSNLEPIKEERLATFIY